MEIAPHYRVVVKNSRGAVLPGEDATLVREVYSGGIDEVDDRDPAAHRDLLRAQNLLDGFRPPRSRLDRRVVGDDYDFAPVNADHGGDDSRRRGLSVVLVVGNQHSHLEHARFRVAQKLNPLASGKLPLLMQLFELLRSARLAQLRFELAHFRTQLPEAVS